MTLAIGRKTLEEGFQFRVERSSKSRYDVRCVQPNCNWRIYAVCIQNTTMFHVRNMNDVHTCSRTQMNPNHRNANSRVLGHIILPKVRDESRKIRGKDIVNDMKVDMHLNISYWQAWRAKAYALTIVQGTPEESFSRLPAFFYNLELNNPGTFTRIKTDNTGRFEMCFAALGCSIRSFLGHLRRVLIIDDAHLKGPYLGTMFLAIAMDANNQIVPVAFGVGRSESGETWTWFLTMLKECIQEPEGLVFISDRALSISQAINTVYPNAHHSLCCRHLLMNVKSRDSRAKFRKGMFWKTCKAYTEEDFERKMEVLRRVIPVGAPLMDAVGKEKWSQAYFPGMRYNIMTSNSAESVNALSRFARKLHIVSLMDYFREFQQDWYSIRRNKAARWVNALPPKIEIIVRRRQVKSERFIVHEIGYGLYEVQDSRKDAKVDYHRYSCSCRKWQISGLPCSHAIAVARHERCTDVIHLVSPYFKADNFRATYSEVIHPPGHPDTWVVPDTPLMTVKPPVYKRRAGRPSNHDRIPSRGEDPTPRRCTRCGEIRHTRTQCQAPAPVNRGSQRASGSRTNTDDYGGTYRHQTFDLNVDLNE
ncbi:hypothetical protein L6452_28213 [Arctium lappa]|uniref:Uncharacterized protein n=1 Tax=Arctium lappa TaxID=4217 RepID=A0ACB9A259_ARCLA|nr:hypothetical protein L6452_28213 [Arctium lappa]